MEDSAIREGFANLKPGWDYDRLHQTALCRAGGGLAGGIWNMVWTIRMRRHFSL
ncbi:MAG: hypothetical protein HDT38_01860 [Clostridiales bacterium]|nr:hypothetical protein [Clostridiales bacterium]